MVRTQCRELRAVIADFLLLWRSERAYGGKIAVIDGERRFSYAAFADRVRRLAGLLYDLGVSNGDIVSVLAPNSALLLEAHYAVPLRAAC